MLECWPTYSVLQLFLWGFRFYLPFGKSKTSKSFCISEPEYPRDVFSSFIFEFPLNDFCLCEQQTLFDEKP